MAIHRLLIVEDDISMRDMMVAFMRSNGFLAVSASTEDEIHTEIDKWRIDMILLDVLLGKERGTDICKRLRTSTDVPIMIVSALSADHQRMEGYCVGADDYVSKPFNPDLLLARIRAVLRRTRRSPSLQHRKANGNWDFAGWHFGGAHGVVYSPEGVQIQLSNRECSLLRVLLANQHIPLSREEIAAALDVTGDQEISAEVVGRSIDVLVGRLRSKIEANPKEPQILLTERGVGYVFSAEATCMEE